jgi:hypothetical protein
MGSSRPPDVDRDPAAPDADAGDRTPASVADGVGSLQVSTAGATTDYYPWFLRCAGKHGESQCAQVQATLAADGIDRELFGT